MNEQAQWINGWFCKASLTYPEYLQAKEFEKSYRYAIDEQTSALIANERDLAQANIAVLREQNSLLAEISSTVSAKMDEINGTLNWGFSEVIAGIGRLNDQIADLIKIARTPAQTWAYEQFDIARDAFRKDLYSESLRYLDRAINGAGGNVGYDIDFRFHFLKGIIFLGSEKNADPAIVNLHEAESSFLLAARYSRSDYPKEAARALLCAGRAAFCSRQLDRALQHTNESLAVSPAPLAEAHFQKAKIHCASGINLDAAATSVVAAIQLDKLYGLKVCSDGDLLPHKPLIMQAIEEVRLLLEDEVIREENQIARCLAMRRTAKICNIDFAVVESRALAACGILLQQIQARRANETYYCLLENIQRLAKLRGMMDESLRTYPEAICKELSNQSRLIQNDTAAITKEIETRAHTTTWCLVVVAGFSLSAIFCTWDRSRNASEVGTAVRIIEIIVLGVVFSIPCMILYFLKSLIKLLIKLPFQSRIAKCSLADAEVKRHQTKMNSGEFQRELKKLALASSAIK